MKEEIEKYLSEHPHLNLATSDKSGSPWASTVAFVSNGSVVYFMTSPNSRKVRNLKENPKVAYTVDEDSTDWKKTKAVQMEGTAVVLPVEQMEQIIPLFAQKFPQFSDMPEGKGFVLVMVTPVKGYFIDASKGMGHHDKVEY